MWAVAPDYNDKESESELVESGRGREYDSLTSSVEVAGGSIWEISVL